MCIVLYPFTLLPYMTSAQFVFLLLKNFFWKSEWLRVKNIFIKNRIGKGNSGKAFKKNIAWNS
jgi:hypothetical protein